MSRKDPLEEMVEKSLQAASISYEKDVQFYYDDGSSKTSLDFYLPVYDTYIEVKRYHAPRVLRQLEVHENIILLQGLHGVSTFCKFLWMKHK